MSERIQGDLFLLVPTVTHHLGLLGGEVGNEDGADASQVPPPWGGSLVKFLRSHVDSDLHLLKSPKCPDELKGSETDVMVSRDSGYLFCAASAECGYGAVLEFH